MSSLVRLFVLAGIVLFVATPAGAAVSARSAQVIAENLTSAYLTATEVERDLAANVGKALPPALASGLNTIQGAVISAEGLANDDPHLAPGLVRVRELVEGIKASPKVKKEAVAQMNEATIRLYALQINAHILEAAAHLRLALGILGQKRFKEVEMHLTLAERALTLAAEHGGYHIENDIEEIQAALQVMKNKAGQEIPLVRENVEARIEEIEDHLFDVTVSP